MKSAQGDSIIGKTFPNLLTQDQQLTLAKHFADHYEKILVDKILKAILEKDSKTIHEIGDIVERLSTFQNAADPKRAAIIALKIYCKATNKKLNIRELAERIEWRQPDASDGFAQLRRMCLELGFPLAETRQISYKRKPRNLEQKPNKAAIKTSKS